MATHLRHTPELRHSPTPMPPTAALLDAALGLEDAMTATLPTVRVDADLRRLYARRDAVADERRRMIVELDRLTRLQDELTAHIARYKLAHGIEICEEDE